MRLGWASMKLMIGVTGNMTTVVGHTGSYGLVSLYAACRVHMGRNCAYILRGHFGQSCGKSGK